jgi:hypothetical protein
MLPVIVFVFVFLLFVGIKHVSWRLETPKGVLSISCHSKFRIGRLPGASKVEGALIGSGNN